MSLYVFLTNLNNQKKQKKRVDPEGAEQRGQHKDSCLVVLAVPSHNHLCGRLPCGQTLDHFCSPFSDMTHPIARHKVDSRDPPDPQLGANNQERYLFSCKMSNIPTPAIDAFLDSLGVTIALPTTEQWNNALMTPSSIPPPPPPPLPLSRATAFYNNSDEVDIPPLPPAPPSRNRVGQGLSAQMPSEPGLELHYLDNHPYGVKKVNGVFCVYTLDDISPLRSHRYVGRAVRGVDGDGPLTDIDRSLPDPEAPAADMVARVLFPLLQASIAQ